MSGYPAYPGGYQAFQSPGVPPGGPPAGQFLAALQAITTALNSQAQAVNSLGTALSGAAGLTPTNFTQIHLSGITAPAPPSSGIIIYVDSTSSALMAVKADGTRITLG